MKVIFHIDMNSFFASCHQALDPQWEATPLVVSSPSRRAIVTTANYAARKLGINSPMPLYKAKEIYPQLKIVNPDFELYVEFAQKLFDFISSHYTNQIEVASIDECYIDVTNIYLKYGTAMQLAIDMQQNVFQQLGLPNSIGISYNKSLAKIASDLKKPMGITLIRPEDIPHLVDPLPVNKLFGIGKQTTERLNALGIMTIKDLAEFSDLPLLETILGKPAISFVERAKGGGSDKLLFEHNKLKQIGNETTLEYDLGDFEEIKNKIYLLSKHVSQRAQKRTMVGNVVYVTLKNTNRKRFTKQQTIPKYTNLLDDIYSTAISLFDQFWMGQPIRLIGVGLRGIISKYDIKEQISFDSLSNFQSESSTVKLIKEINKKYRKDILLTGQKLVELKYVLQAQTKYIQADQRILDETKLRSKDNE
ncbi:DNA polymerase IV [Spiroplasma sp. SV19]|uniref:DNA polymerase IV n=1 Tax=Spiroplasma sp. SV19 TaxID=2570468 RepID=UPI0024B76F0D|nr:DNA polymerase IV [Spiroplasma sp. SV19]WHQ36592.1 DNA polymerase IV [Spiroplasma sp. SV19]